MLLSVPALFLTSPKALGRAVSLAAGTLYHPLTSREANHDAMVTAQMHSCQPEGCRAPAQASAGSWGTSCHLSRAG